MLDRNENNYRVYWKFSVACVCVCVYELGRRENLLNSLDNECSTIYVAMAKVSDIIPRCIRIECI